MTGPCGYYESSALNNGLPVLSITRPGLRSANLVLAIGVGSRDDPPTAQGLSHLCEHMLFRGSSRFQSSDELLSLIENTGGSMNGGTNPETTSLYTRLPAESLGLGLRILSDLALHPLFDEETFQLEQRITTEEVLGLEDDAPLHLRQLLHGLLWPGHPLSWPVAGTRDTIAGITCGQVIEHHQRFYRPTASVLAIVSPLSHAEIVSATGEFFGSWQGPTYAQARVACPPPPDLPGLCVESWPGQQAQISLGLLTFPYSDADREAINVLNYCLGQGQSSPLVRTLRDHEALTYYVESAVRNYTDTGKLTFNLETDSSQSVVATLRLMAVIGDVLRSITDDDIATKKQALRSYTELEWEDPLNIAEWMAANYLSGGRYSDPNESLAAIEHVTSAQVRSLVRRVFQQPPQLAVVGPDLDEGQFADVLATQAKELAALQF